MQPRRKTKITYLEFSFTQKERDYILQYCVLRRDIERQLRKIVPVGHDIIVVFDKPGATEMMNSLLQAGQGISDDEGLKGIFEDLHDRFEEKYYIVFRR